MKTISLLQPWASLVIMGYKRIETRSWNTKHRGELLIHASAGKKAEYRSLMLDFQQQFYKLQLPKYESLPFGAIIGKVNLLHTVKSEFCFEGNEFELSKDDKPYKFELTEQELAFGDYRMNRYGWLLGNPVQFAKPIPAKGALGLWEYYLPDHFHVPNKYGGHATFDTPPTLEVLQAVDEMAELAFNKLKRQ